VQQDSKSPAIRSYRDDELGDVLVLHKSDLPTLSYERAVAWLRELDVTVSDRILRSARSRGQLVGSLIGNEVYLSKRELLEWLQSRRGATSGRPRNAANGGPRR